MKQRDVIIRRKTDVDLFDTRFKRAFTTVEKNTEIPIYYQYCQETQSSGLVSDDNMFIGKAKEIRENPDGDIVCTVIINDVLKLASHFQGVIDNFKVSIAPDEYGNMKPKLLQLIIYDKDFKKAVDEKMAKAKKDRALVPVEGDIAPIRDGENPLKSKDVRDAIDADLNQFRDTHKKESEENEMEEKERVCVAMEVAGAESIPECYTEPQVVAGDTAADDDE